MGEGSGWQCIMSRARWLHGWHRLFVLLAGLYGTLIVGVVGVGYYSAKQNAEYKASAARAEVERLAERYRQPGDVAPAPTASRAKADYELLFGPRTSPAGRDWTKELFGTHEAATPEEARTAVQRRRTKEEAWLSALCGSPCFELLQPLLWPAFLVWAIPLAILYALGWAVCWVRRGFAAPRA